jgi:hypothetical protein
MRPEWLDEVLVRRKQIANAAKLATEGLVA